MPDYHDVFWRLLFQRMNCAIEFFRFLLGEKVKILELEKLLIVKDIYYRKKKYCTTYYLKFPLGTQQIKCTFLLSINLEERMILKFK